MLFSRLGKGGLCIGIVAAIALAAGGSTTGSADPGYVQALWVWPDARSGGELADAVYRYHLVDRSARSGVDALYVSVYRSTENDAGRLMYRDEHVAGLISLAHARGLEVWAAYGNADWPRIGCDPGAFPRQRMAEVVAYNLENPLARFDGVILAVGAPAEGDLSPLLSLYTCILNDDLRPAGLKMAAAIRHFWDTAITFPPIAGATKEAYKHIIDLDLDRVVVMANRDLRWTGCPSLGIICLLEDEVEYAKQRGKGNRILAGLETQDCRASGTCAEHETFFEEGQRGLNLEARGIARHFRRSAYFGGFAINHYGDAYLSGRPRWPKVNHEFPPSVFAGRPATMKKPLRSPQIGLQNPAQVR